MPSHYVPNTRIPTLVFPDSGQAARHVALLIETLIRQNNAADRPTSENTLQWATEMGPHSTPLLPKGWQVTPQPVAITPLESTPRISLPTVSLKRVRACL